MKLHVIMLDTWRTTLAGNEGQSMPFGRRLVSIDLTNEQANMLTRRRVGRDIDGREILEEIGEVWIEEVEE